MKKGEKAQVWIETVIYTLIAFAILGAVLAFAKPKIEELQDKSIIEQSIKMLEDIDGIIGEIRTVQGNQRQMALELKKGTLTIDSANDNIFFNLESRYAYSEPCENDDECTPYTKGDINITTIKFGNKNNIIAILDYENRYDIKWDGNDRNEMLIKSSTPYNLLISNNGVSEGKTIINFKVQ